MTIAVTATSAEPAPYDPAISAAALEHARQAADPRDGLITVVVGTAGPVVPIDLTPMRGTEVEHDTAMAQQKIEAKLPALETALVGADSAAPTLDWLGVFDRGLRATPSGGTLLMVSSGVSTADPLDLRVIGFDGDPAAIAGDLKARKLLPDASGRHVVLAGVGITAGTQPMLPLPARSFLQQLLITVCQATGAASCTMAPPAAASQRPASTTPVPVVPVTMPPTTCLGGLVLPGDVYFVENSWQLTKTAKAALAELAATLKKCPAGRIITFTGHTARVTRTGNTGFTISKNRALAVREELRSNGVPDQMLGDAFGVGDTQPIVDNYPATGFNEALAQQNRRVELSIAQS